MQREKKPLILIASTVIGITKYDMLYNEQKRRRKILSFNDSSINHSEAVGEKVNSPI